MKYYKYGMAIAMIGAVVALFGLLSGLLISRSLLPFAIGGVAFGSVGLAACAVIMVVQMFIDE